MQILANGYPTLGEGGSEGALALGVADRVLMMENAIYTVISPEGAAELLYQDESRADEAAESLKLTAQDCRDYGIVVAVGGCPVMLVVLDFGFMGGTMGCVVGEKVALAFEHAAKKKRRH